MKKVFKLLMVATIFSLIACGGPTAEEKAAKEAEAEAMVEDMFNGLEAAMDDVVEEKTELAEHVCDAKCEKEGCTGARCGEKGHECTGECHKKDGDAEHTCDGDCTKGKHKCGKHCGCGDECTCAEGTTCSGKCDIKSEEEVIEE